jgi:hypothetical protein
MYVPAETKRRLQRLAKKEFRTLSAQCLHIFERELDAYEAAAGITYDGPNKQE